MDIKLLSKSSKETLSIIKKEAEMNLDKIHLTEDIITSKINNLLNIVISFFLIVSGYILKSISISKFDELSYISFVLSILFIVVISVLYSGIMPKGTILVGTEPSKLIQSDMIKGDDNDNIRILGNRIINLQNAIDVSSISYKSRLKAFKLSFGILNIGIFVIMFLTITFLLCQGRY